MVTDVLIDVPSLSNSKERNGELLLPWFCNEKPECLPPVCPSDQCVSHISSAIALGSDSTWVSLISCTAIPPSLIELVKCT